MNATPLLDFSVMNQIMSRGSRLFSPVTSLNSETIAMLADFFSDKSNHVHVGFSVM
jgi:hypothetical protein